MGEEGVPSSHKTAVLVPIKPFADAKTRLAPACSQSQREHLARAMARTVLRAASGMRTAVVAPQDAADVRRFALINGARFLSEPEETGLNPALAYGSAELRDRGYTRVAVVLSDLPLVKDLGWLHRDDDKVIIVSDRSGRGTNAISFPTSADFQFSFGPGSLQRHCDEATRHSLEFETVADIDGVSSDVDDIDDAMRTGVFLANDPITMENDIIVIDDVYGTHRHAR